MGWKSIKEKYNIKHTVAVYGDEGICIGSAYIHDLIRISFDGKLTKIYDSWSGNEDLKRYVTEMKVDEATSELKRLCQCEDTFGQLFPVYTFQNGRIVKKWCETYGWPNVTTDGSIMYENTFFQTYEMAYAFLLDQTKKFVKFSTSHFRQDIRPDIQHIKYRIGSLLREYYDFIYSRTIEPLKHGLLKNK